MASLPSTVRRRLSAGLVVAALAAALTGCSLGEPAPVTTDFQVGGDRPATVRLPLGFEASEASPLLVVLHGYMGTAASIEGWLHLGDAATVRGMLVVTPDGTTDVAGDQFWNSTEGDCCDLYDSGVDDSAYLSQLIDEISSRVSVDPKRIYIFGHSNGGFMAYRMACDHADQIAAIVSFAGVTAPEADCSPSEPVSTLQIHGTADTDIPYNGYSTHPSAEQMAEIWAALDGCDLTADTTAAPFDLDAGLYGAETHSTAFTDGCLADTSATLWTIEGGRHLPSPSPAFTDLVLDYLEAQAQP